MYNLNLELTTNGVLNFSKEYVSWRNQQRYHDEEGHHVISGNELMDIVKISDFFKNEFGINTSIHGIESTLYELAKQDHNQSDDINKNLLLDTTNKFSYK